MLRKRIVLLGTKDVEVQNLLGMKEYKKTKTQEKCALLNEKEIKQELVNGHSFLYLLKDHYLHLSDEVLSTKLKGRYFYTSEGARENLREMFKEFFCYHGKIFIKSMIPRFLQMMGLKVEKVSIINRKNRLPL
ncbi:MAG: DUF45 domain-containing protein [Prolixibacteraceae bacterium]|nr:DUF45 domain-containing protein [Prolixibacteraceae bacterium]